MNTLPKRGYINSNELLELLKERKEGKTDFLLIDVREKMEFRMGYIRGVDMLKPTSSFGQWAEDILNETRDKVVIFTCHTGSRSGQIQSVFKRNGHQSVINHYGGIASYRGEVIR